MNLDELRSVQNAERATDSLQELRDSFYADVADYVEELREERDRRAEAADDPFSDPEVSRLNDEIEMAEQVAEAIYERRVGKIVKQASLAAAGMSGDTEGLTDEECDLYADLVERIETNKEHVLDVLAGDADESPVDAGADGSGGEPPSPASAPAGESDAPAGDDDASADASDPTGDAAVPADEAAAGEAVAGDDAGDGDAGGESAVSRETVRITRDVGEIFGVDERTYTLEAEDVVSLPEANAAPLVDREAAERLE